jgi:peroxiredoxin
MPSLPINLHEPAPDFTLPAHDGHQVRVPDPYDPRPTLVVFARGHWCFYCKRYLTKLQTRRDDFAARNVRVVVVSPEPPATSMAMAAELGLSYPIAADVDGVVVDAYGVRNRFGAVATVLPHSAVYLLDGAGVIRFRAVDRNYKKLTTLRTILQAIDELQGCTHRDDATLVSA